jgi:hypothetical protein
METTEKKSKPPFGVIAVALINFIFGFAGIFLGISGVAIQPFQSVFILIQSGILFVSELGLLQLKSWAWYLTVVFCATSLAFHPFLPSEKAFPLEFLLLSYLLWKRGIFGVKFRGGRREND